VTGGGGALRYSKNPIIAPAGKSTADEKSRSLTPAGVHACPADFAMIAGRAESRERNLRARRCTQRTFYRVAPIAAIARSHCARVGRGALVIGRPTCILTGDCLRAHALRQAEVVGATLLSSFSRVCARARARVCVCVCTCERPTASLRFRKFNRPAIVDLKFLLYPRYVLPLPQNVPRIPAELILSVRTQSEQRGAR